MKKMKEKEIRKLDMQLRASSAEDNKMEITRKRMVILASAISYIFTIIFTGFKLIA